MFGQKRSATAVTLTIFITEFADIRKMPSSSFAHFFTLANKYQLTGWKFQPGTRRRRTALSGFWPDLLCGVCQSKSEIFSREVFECPDFEFELDFDRQTPHSNSGQNPDVCLDRILSADVCLEPLIRSITYLIVEASPFSKWFWSFFAQLATPPPLGSSAILSKFVLDWPNTFDNFRRTFLKDIWNIIWFSKILRY